MVPNSEFCLLTSLFWHLESEFACKGRVALQATCKLVKHPEQSDEAGPAISEFMISKAGEGVVEVQTRRAS